MPGCGCLVARFARECFQRCGGKGGEDLQNCATHPSRRPGSTLLHRCGGSAAPLASTASGEETGHPDERDLDWPPSPIRSGTINAPKAIPRSRRRLDQRERANDDIQRRRALQERLGSHALDTAGDTNDHKQQSPRPAPWTPGPEQQAPLRRSARRRRAALRADGPRATPPPPAPSRPPAPKAALR